MANTCPPLHVHSIHICFTGKARGQAEPLLKDLREAIDIVVADPSLSKTGMLSRARDACAT